MAGLIPQQFIDDLLDRTDIVDIVDSRVGLRKTGKNYSALCPFHDEKTPSFSVSPDKQIFHCFGCGAGGNAIGFVMDYDRVDFRTAVEELAKRAGMELPRESQQAPQQSARQLSLYTQLEKSQRYYQRQLRESAHKDRAIDYLKRRGLSGQIAKDFAIGYAPPGWENLHSALVESSTDENLLISAGMLIEKETKHSESNALKGAETHATPQKRSSYDRFRDRIMFPIRDSRGRTIAFGGRVLGDDKPKYLNSPESPVFHKGRELYGLYEAKQANNRIKRFLIVEGYMDVVALAQHGIHYAVATLGTATSETHLNKLFRIAPELVFCFDGDQAGRTAAQRALETLLPVLEDGRQAKFLFLPEGEDPDTLVRSEGSDRFEHRINDAQAFSDFFFEHISKEIDIGSIDGKAHLSKRALPLIKRLPTGAISQLMLARLGQITGLDLPHLEQMLRKEQPAKSRPSVPSSEGSGERKKTNRQLPPSRSTDSIAQRALRLVLQQPELAAQAPDIVLFSDQEDSTSHLLIEVLKELRDNPSMNAAILVHHWHGKPEQDELIRLASKEALKIDHAKEFQEIMSRLQTEQQTFRLNQLKDLVVSGQADPTQQREYIALLAELKRAPQ